MINRVVLVGRMTRDPELRRTANQTAVTSFSLAVNRNFTSADGQSADYINCVVWNKAAENVERYCSKGSLVGVEGRIQTRSYDNQQGQKVYVVEVVCDSVQFLETRAAREKAQTQQSMQQPTNNNFQNNMSTLQQEFDNSSNSFDVMDDELPF